MKIQKLLLILFLGIYTNLFAQNKILVVTGGHDFEQNAFFSMFDSFENIKYDWVVQPAGNELIQSDKVNSYNVIVFYDMFQEISDTQKAAYVDILSKGIGMVFLHHSLVSYQDWSEFQNIIGGKYLLNEIENQPKSTYKHDVLIDVNIVDKDHPITKNIKDFTIQDEVYGKYVVNKSVSPLLKTKHPESTDIIGWHHNYKNSRVVYLQSGHDQKAYEDRNFRKILFNAINWAKMNDVN